MDESLLWWVLVVIDVCLVVLLLLLVLLIGMDIYKSLSKWVMVCFEVFYSLVII